MVAFFNRISDAITSFSFYQQLAATRFRQVLGSYLVFLLLFSIIRSVPFLSTALPLATQQVQVTLNELAQSYPDQLTFTWDGSTLAASQPQISVPYPSTVPASTFASTKTKLLAKIDTTTPTPAADTNALFTVGQKSVGLPTADAAGNAVPLSALFAEPFTITKQTVAQLPNQWQQLKTPFITGLVLGTPLAIAIVLIAQRLIAALIEASLFYVFKYLMGSSWSYATAVKYTLTFFIPAEIIDFVAQLVYPQHSFSFFSLTAWIYFLAITFYPGFRRWQSLQRE